MSSDSNGRMREHLFNFTCSCASIIKSVCKILMDECESTFLVSHTHVHQSDNQCCKILNKEENERFEGVNLPCFLNNARLNLIPKVREKTPSKNDSYSNNFAEKFTVFMFLIKINLEPTCSWWSDITLIFLFFYFF